MTSRPATIDTAFRYEYGLRLPNGAELWPPTQFYGIDYQTTGQRALVLAAIKDAITNMSLPEVPTLDQYGWLVRVTEVVTVETELEVNLRDLDDPGLVEEDDDETVVLDAEEVPGT